MPHIASEHSGAICHILLAIIQEQYVCNFVVSDSTYLRCDVSSWHNLRLMTTESEAVMASHSGMV